MSDGQWLAALWTVVVIALLAGLIMGISVLVVLSLLGAAGAGYTTFLFVRQQTSSANFAQDPDEKQ
jgi:uncharacterized membrane protein YdjX (TVP38/TMEM64 family)